MYEASHVTRVHVDTEKYGKTLNILFRLPRVPYLTILDHIVFASVASLQITALGMCVAYAVGAGKGFSDTADQSGQHFDMRAARIVDLISASALVTIQLVWALQIYVLRILGGWKNVLEEIFPLCCVPGLLKVGKAIYMAVFFLPFCLKMLLWTVPRQAVRLLFSCSSSCGERSRSASSTATGKKAAGRIKVDPSGREQNKDGANSKSSDDSETSAPAPPEKEKRLTKFGTRTWASGPTIKHDFLVPEPGQSFLAAKDKTTGKFKFSRVKIEQIMGVRGTALNHEDAKDF